jgi:hypothetical protein
MSDSPTHEFWGRAEIAPRMVLMLEHVPCEPQ